MLGERLLKKTVQEGPSVQIEEQIFSLHLLNSQLLPLAKCWDCVEPHPVHLPIISKGAKSKAWAAVIQTTHTYSTTALFPID